MKKSYYGPEEGIMNIEVRKGEYWKSIETPSGVVIDISKDGQILEIEIPNAKKVFSGQDRKVLQTAQTR